MKNLAIIGYPVMHSLSPKMHNFISNELGIDYFYRHIEVAPENLEQAIAELRQEKISGFNVTAPHKVEVMKYLDRISTDAKIFGAVNTVVSENGSLVGYNTDAKGFYESLVYSGADVENKDVLILGAGGAATPVSMYLASKNPKSLTISNRTKEKVEALCDKVFGYCGFCADVEMKLDRYDIVINCTSLGMGKNIGISPISDYSIIDKDTCVVDMIYAPAETELLKQARLIGAKTLNGLGMLVFQGILAYRLFTGAEVPDNMADRIIKEVLLK